MFAISNRKFRYNKNKLVQILILKETGLTARTDFWTAYMFWWGDCEGVLALTDRSWRWRVRLSSALMRG